jgi:hypothetical protein
MTMTTTKVIITFPTPLLERVETLRGDIPRSTYIKNVLENVMSTRNEGVMKDTPKYTEVKLPNRSWLERYMVEKIDDDGGEEYSYYRRFGYRHPVDGIFFALSEQQVVLVDEESSWLQKCLATDFFLRETEKQIEEHLDLFLKARGEFLFYTYPRFKGIKEKLLSLGLDPKAYEKKCREVMGPDAPGGEELDCDTEVYSSYRVDERVD